MVLDEAFIHLDGKVLLPRHGVEGGETVLVPIVGGVEPRGLAKFLHGRLGVVLPYVAEGGVIMRGIVLRKGFRDDRKTRQGVFDVSRVIVLHRVHKQ